MRPPYLTMPNTDNNKIRGVVLSTVRYGDSNLVVNILTADGRRAFMVGAGHGTRRSTPAAVTMPLSLVEFVAGRSRKGGMPRMSGLQFAHPCCAIPFDPVRRAEALFIAELITHAVPADVPDPELFDFVWHSVLRLDEGMPGLPSFHLLFMMQLSQYLGFGHELKTEGCNIFDMEAGQWVAHLPTHPYVLTDRAAQVWHIIESADEHNLSQMGLSRQEKCQAIDAMSTYFRLHTPGFGSLQSHLILAQLS